MLQWMFLTFICAFACFWHLCMSDGLCEIQEDLIITLLPLPLKNFKPLFSVKSVTDPPSWHQPGSPERKRVPREIIRGLSSSPMHATSTPFHQRGYVRTHTASSLQPFLSEDDHLMLRLCVCVCVFRLSSCQSAAAASTAWRGSSWSWMTRRSPRIRVWPAARLTNRPAQVSESCAGPDYNLTNMLSSLSLSLKSSQMSNDLIYSATSQIFHYNL